MKKGLRIDVKGLVKKIQGRLSKITADDFRPELSRHAKRVLISAAKLTPQRNLALIRKAQIKQYQNRVNYIPSIHEESDPMLIVKDEVFWLHAGGNWYAASYRELPHELESVFQELVSERNRRLETSQADFIAERAQARFLYRKTWSQIAASIGVPIPSSAQIQASRSRPYHSPPDEPPAAYGQWRGGKVVLSIAIFNPFLERETAYWSDTTGKEILAEAVKINYPAFMGEVQAKLQKLLSAAK